MFSDLLIILIKSVISGSYMHVIVLVVQKRKSGVGVVSLKQET